MRRNNDTIDLKNRFLGCMIGGAIGDAMGYTMENIFGYGSEEITEPYVDEEMGQVLISDDTQLAIFTMDGLLWAYIRCSNRGIGTYEGSGVWQSYGRWYYTQTGQVLDEYIMHKHEHEPVALNMIGVKTVLEYEELYSNRLPSEETLSAISTLEMGTMEMPLNDFKDASCLARVAPVGMLLHDNPEQAFLVAARIAAITHGNPTGYLAAGAYACIIAEVINGKALDESVRNALFELKKYTYIDEVNDTLDYALHLSECEVDWKAVAEMIGRGDSAEDVLALGVFFAIKAESYEEAARMAANSGGCSSSVGFIACSIVGAMMGEQGVPEEWKNNLELRKMMTTWVDKLYQLREF